MVWLLLGSIALFTLSERFRVFTLSIGMIVFAALPIVISFGTLLLFLNMVKS